MNDAPLVAPEAVDAARAALREAGIVLPHLAGLAGLVRVAPDARVASAAVFASGRLVVNPAWLLALQPDERRFVAAHALLHLALASHARCVGSESDLANIAEDYIINDLLRGFLGGEVPAGGLDCVGIATLAAERLVGELRRRRMKGEVLPGAPWSAPPGGEAIAEAAPFDVFDALVERRWFPDEDASERARRARRIAAAACDAVALGVWRDALAGGVPEPAGTHAAILRARHDTRFLPAWEGALQHWLEAAAPAVRSFARRSRHDEDASPLVRAGRIRRGWTLDIVLDTEGRGEEILSAVKALAPCVGLAQIRLHSGGVPNLGERLVAIEDWDPAASGGGCGNLVPVLRRLEAEGAATGVLVVTDGGEESIAPPPYPMLWAYTEA